MISTPWNHNRFVWALACKFLIPMGTNVRGDFLSTFLVSKIPQLPPSKCEFQLILTSWKIIFKTKQKIRKSPRTIVPTNITKLYVFGLCLLINYYESCDHIHKYSIFECSLSRYLVWHNSVIYIEISLIILMTMNHSAYKNYTHQQESSEVLAITCKFQLANIFVSIHLLRIDNTCNSIEWE